jgi:hypothetical protein
MISSCYTSLGGGYNYVFDKFEGLYIYIYIYMDFDSACSVRDLWKG